MKNTKGIKFVLGLILAYFLAILYYVTFVNQEVFGYEEIENPTIGFLEEVKKRYVEPINNSELSDLDINVFIRNKNCEFNANKHIKVTINNIILDDLYIFNDEFYNDDLYGVVKFKDSKIKYKAGKILTNLGFNNDVVSLVNTKIFMAINRCKNKIDENRTQEQIEILNEKANG
jgi:hypothetical protein